MLYLCSHVTVKIIKCFITMHQQHIDPSLVYFSLLSMVMVFLLQLQLLSILYSLQCMSFFVLAYHILRSIVYANLLVSHLKLSLQSYVCFHFSQCKLCTCISFCHCYVRSLQFQFVHQFLVSISKPNEKRLFIWLEIEVYLF